MGGEIAQVDQTESHFAGSLFEAGRVFRCGKVIVDGVGVRHSDLAGQHGLNRQHGGVDGVLHRSDDMHPFHGNGMGNAERRF